jgi:hypothetical protein
MTFVYEVPEVQYMALVMIVPIVYLVCGIIFGAGGKK